MLVCACTDGNVLFDFLTSELDRCDLLGVTCKIGDDLFLWLAVDLHMLVGAASQNVLAAVIDVDSRNTRCTRRMHRWNGRCLRECLDNVGWGVIGWRLSLATALRQANITHMRPGKSTYRLPSALTFHSSR